MQAALGPPPAKSVSVRAYAIATTVPIRDFAAAFPESRVRSTKTQLIVQYSETSWAALFDFGAAVFFDVQKDERDRVMKLLSALDGSEPKALLNESFLIDIAPGKRPAAQFERANVEELNQPSVEVVSLVIGQSVAMEYHEEDVDRILGRLQDYARTLSTEGRFRGSVRQLLRFIGQGMALRNRVIYTIALLDSPAITWENQGLDRLHKELRDSFAIEDRYRALDHKLQVIGDNLELLVDIIRQQRSLWLEMSIVALILIEVILFVMQMSHSR